MKKLAITSALLTTVLTLSVQPAFASMLLDSSLKVESGRLWRRLKILDPLLELNLMR